MNVSRPLVITQKVSLIVLGLIFDLSATVFIHFRFLGAIRQVLDAYL